MSQPGNLSIPVVRVLRLGQLTMTRVVTTPMLVDAAVVEVHGQGTLTVNDARMDVDRLEVRKAGLVNLNGGGNAAGYGTDAGVLGASAGGGCAGHGVSSAGDRREWRRHGGIVRRRWRRPADSGLGQAGHC